MAWALRKYRIHYTPEDAGDTEEVHVPYVDALDEADCFTDYEAEHEGTEAWVCDECGTHNGPVDRSCLYCGRPSCT